MPGNSRSLYLKDATIAQVKEYLKGRHSEPQENGKFICILPAVRIEFTEQEHGVLVTAKCKPWGAVSAKDALDKIAKDLALLRGRQSAMLAGIPQKES